MGSRLEKISDWIPEAHRAGYSCDALAMQTGMSPRQLQRHFRKKFGISPGKWLKQVRLDDSARLLEEGVPIKQVATAVFFKHPSGFSLAFQKGFGVSPRKFTKSYLSAKVSHLSTFSGLK